MTIDDKVTKRLDAWLECAREQFGNEYAGKWVAVHNGHVIYASEILVDVMLLTTKDPRGPQSIIDYFEPNDIETEYLLS